MWISSTPARFRLGQGHRPAEQPPLAELELIPGIHDVETVVDELIEEVEPEGERQEIQEMIRTVPVDSIHKLNK